MKDFFNDNNRAGVLYSIFICFNICLTFIGQVIVLSFAEQTSFVFRVVCSFLPMLAVAVSSFIYCLYTKEKLSTIVSFNRCKVVCFLFSFAIFIGMYFGLGLVNYKIADMVKKIGLNANESTLTIDGVWQFVTYLIVIGIMTPVFEEVFFRGTLLNSLKDFSPIFSIIFSAVCFALFHGNISQLLYQFVYGIFLSMLTYYSKSVIPSMITHAMNNIFVLFLLFYHIDISNIMQKWYVIIIGVLILLLVAIYLVYNIKKKDIEKKNKNYKQTILTSLFGIGIMLLMIVLNMVEG